MENVSKTGSEKGIFLQALEIESREQRDHFLQDACGDDQELLSGVIALLQCAKGDLLGEDDLQVLNRERVDLCEALNTEGDFIDQLGAQGMREFGDYELLDELGRGGMGVVFRARQKSLNREVAVKIVLSAVLVSETERARFRVEAEAAARLDHPNIVPVYEVGDVQGHDFYSMALMRGGTLGEMMKNRRFTPSEAVGVMLDVAGGVQAAHNQAVIHRDLKPDNVLLNAEEQPCVADFGLACWLDRESHLTLSGQLMGTPQYMAPELADSRGGAVSIAVDVYALGTILYELLAGVPPFRGDSVLMTLRKVVEDPVETGLLVERGVDKDLTTIVLKCLEKRAEHRYLSVQALMEDLSHWQKGLPISARQPSAPERVAKWIKCKPMHAALVLMALLLVLAFGIGGPLVALQQSDLRRKSEIAQHEADEAKVQAQRDRDKAEVYAEQSKQQALSNRRLAYSANMRYIHLINEINKGMGAQTMIGSWKPDGIQNDVRGWEWFYTYGLIHQDTQEFQAGRLINSLHFSPHGQWILYASDRGSGYRHSLNNSMLREFSDGDAHLLARWNVNASMAATLSNNGVVKIWDPNHSKPIARLPSNTPVLSFSWGADLRSIIALEQGGAVRWWRLESSKQFTLVDEHTGEPFLRQIAWSPNGKHLAAIGESNDVLVYSVSDRIGEVERYFGHKAPLSAMSWQPDSKWLATGSRGGVLRIWGVPGGERIASVNIHETYPVKSIAWNPDGHILGYGSEKRRSVVEVNFISGKTDALHRQLSDVMAVAWNAESHTVAVGDEHGKVRLLRKGLPKTQHVFFKDGSTGLHSLQWNPEGTQVEVLNWKGESSRVDLIKGNESPFKRKLDRLDDNTPVAWSPRSNRVAVGGTSAREDVIEVYHSAGGREKKESFPLGFRKLAGVVWVNESDCLAMSESGELKYLSTRKKQGRWEFASSDRGLKPRYEGFSISPDTRYVLATGKRNRLTLWSTRKGEIIADIQDDGRQWSERHHAWHPGGERFVTGNGRGEISFWQVGDQKPGHQKAAHKGPVKSLAWHPGGERLATAGEDGVIRIWDTESFQLVLELTGHKGAVQQIQWGPNGHRLGSVGADGTLRIWDATAGMLLDRK